MCTAVAAVLVFVSFGGCASPPYMPQRMGLIDTKAPPEIEYANDAFLTPDNVKLYEQRWIPTRGVRGSVVLVHGLKDHSSRYRPLAISFAENGLAVYAYDMRGHGYSEGVRDDVRSVNHCLSDLQTFLTRVQNRAPDKPVYLVGQGFGGTLVALFAVRTRPKIAGLVLVAPSLRQTVKGSERMGSTMAALFTPYSPGMTVDLDHWSSDRDVVEALRRDPMVAPGDVTASTTRVLILANDELQRRTGELTMPLLVLEGAEDRISEPPATAALAAAAPSTDKTSTVYPGLYYDLFHERGRDQVIGETINWLQKHAAVAQAAMASTKSANSIEPASSPAKAAPTRSRKKH